MMYRDESTLTFMVSGRNCEEIAEAIDERFADYFGDRLYEPLIADAIERAAAHVRGHNTWCGLGLVHTHYTAEVVLRWAP